MRLKTFSAVNMKEALQRIRDEFGPDAIIVRSDEGEDRVRVTVAFDRPNKPATDPGKAAPAPSAEAERRRRASSPPAFDAGELTAILSYHGIPFDMAMRLQTAAAALESDSLAAALSGALETCFHFQPIDFHSKGPMMLVGPPGAGKTVATAKLTAELVLAKKPPAVISIDTRKAAGLEQLADYARLMKTEVREAAGPDDLKALLDADRDAGVEGTTLIDSFGVNPFDAADMETLAHYIKTSGAEPVLVLPAGLDPMEAADMAGIFAVLGSRRMITTRFDAARRLASVLTSAQAGRLKISAIGRSPYVADNLERATPLALARLITDLPHPGNETFEKKRAAQ